MNTVGRSLFAVVALVAILAWACFVTGCQLPSFRVFQRKVDGVAAETPAAQLEGQKRAARYIAQRTAAPVKDAPAVVADVHEVAVGLSASLGEPSKPVTADDREAVIASLRAGLLAKDAQLEKWKAFGRKYAGTPLEGTGIDLAGPTGLLVLAGVVAACIFVPGFGWMLLRVIPVLWSGLKRSAGMVEALAREAPEAVAKLKAALPQREDAVRKIVRKAKESTTSTKPLAA